MPTRYQQEQFRSDEFLQTLADTKPFLWLHRPKWLHEDNDTGKPCPCCGSTHAIRTTDDDHLDLLVSRDTGWRKLRQTVEDKGAWDKMTSHADRIEIPFRCHQKQWDASQAYAKILLVTGGVGGGKSAMGAEVCAEEVFLRGGPGATIWWVAPELKHIDIALKKLFIGDFNDGRWEPPIFPTEFIIYYPRSSTQRDLTALLLDGTQIRFWHAGNEGQFKGHQPQLIVVDEGAEIRSESIYAQLRERIMRSNGRMIIPTTPKIPSPAKEIYDDGVPLEDWDGEYASKVWTKFTSFDNPWLPNEWVEAHIKTNMRGDTTRVRREIEGEWISDGQQLWRLYDPQIHLRSGKWRTSEDLGLINITKSATAKFFRGTQSRLTRCGGQDFNLDPMSCEIAEVAVPEGLDQSDPHNWIIVFTDEMVEPSNIYQFCDMLIASGYARLPIACDSSGAHQNPHESHGIKSGSTLAKEMVRKGFDCRPAMRSAAGNPKNLSILDRINIAHKLMGDRLTDSHGVSWPRFIAHSGRCEKLIKSLEGQEATDRGTPAKESGTLSDKLAGPTDAATYLIWAIFSPHEYRKSIKWQ